MPQKKIAKIEIIQKAVPKEVLSENGKVSGLKIADISSQEEKYCLFPVFFLILVQTR